MNRFDNAFKKLFNYTYLFVGGTFAILWTT